MNTKLKKEALADRIVRETMISRQRAIWDAQARLQNALKEGFEKGEKIGIRKGEKIGIRKGLIKITFNMLKKGYNIKEIKDVTGLSESQIKKLKNRINKKKKIKTL